MNITSDIALKIVDKVVGLPVSQIEFVFNGASSSAWKVYVGGTELIVRILRPDSGRPSTFRSESLILRKLQERNAQVPEVIATYDGIQVPGVLNAWSISEMIQGEAIKSNALPRNVIDELGKTLRIVHSLPIKQYGRLKEDQNELVGQYKTPVEGILSRWCWGRLWPFDHTRLIDNSAYSYISELESRIQKWAHKIWSLGKDENCVLVHSDLHGEHIFILNGRLNGIIDFGAAFIGIPEWDFAKLGFYFGWEDTIHIFNAYASENEANAVIDIYLLGLVLSLYKMDRYVTEGKSNAKIMKSMDFLLQTLEKIEKHGCLL